MCGRWTNTAGSTGGDINTGLKRIENVMMQSTGSAVVAASPAVNETIPTTADVGATFTIVTTATTNGVWRAEGF